MQHYAFHYLTLKKNSGVTSIIKYSHRLAYNFGDHLEPVPYLFTKKLEHRITPKIGDLAIFSNKSCHAFIPERSKPL